MIYPPSIEKAQPSNNLPSVRKFSKTFLYFIFPAKDVSEVI